MESKFNIRSVIDAMKLQGWTRISWTFVVWCLNKQLDMAVHQLINAFSSPSWEGVVRGGSGGLVLKSTVKSLSKGNWMEVAPAKIFLQRITRTRRTWWKGGSWEGWLGGEREGSRNGRRLHTCSRTRTRTRGWGKIDEIGKLGARDHALHKDDKSLKISLSSFTIAKKMESISMNDWKLNQRWVQHQLSHRYNADSISYPYNLHFVWIAIMSILNRYSEDT